MTDQGARPPGRPRPAVLAACGLVTLLVLAAPAVAADCRLALALALDVSSSVDAREYSLQREGLARAFVDQEVARLFLQNKPVAVYVFEWASPSMQEPLLPGWLLVESEADLAHIAATLRKHPRTGARDLQRTTAVGAALVHASSALAAVPQCRAHTVDVSGDGRNNVGFEPRYVYANYPFDGVTVNALVITGAAGAQQPQRRRRPDRLVPLQCPARPRRLLDHRRRIRRFPARHEGEAPPRASDARRERVAGGWPSGMTDLPCLPRTLGGGSPAVGRSSFGHRQSRRQGLETPLIRTDLERSCKPSF